jgi:hypothetical protein
MAFFCLNTPLYVRSQPLVQTLRLNGSSMLVKSHSAFSIPIFALLTSLFFGARTSAQTASITPVTTDTSAYGHIPELEYIGSNFPSFKSFIFRRVAQEYIANENGFLLDVKLDTAFLIFKRATTDTSWFTGTFYSDDEGQKPFLKANSIEKIPLEIKISPNGKITQLRNWKQYRDHFVSALSKQAKADLINSVYFKEQKELLNSEGVIRLMVMEDLHYLFDFYGDTVDLNLSYLRVKGLKSPFSQETLQVLGDLKIERVHGAANTLKFKAQNRAEGPIKQQLMEEAIKYLKVKERDSGSSTQILTVGLNSEQEIDYNIRSKCLMTATLSDVVVLNLQSRGNVRVYQLWDYRFPWE